MFAIKIFAFSNRLGERTPIDLSRMKPEKDIEMKAIERRTQTHTLVQIRVGQLAADLLDDLDMIQVRRALHAAET